MKTDLDLASLRKNSDTILDLPERAHHIMDSYLQMDIGGVKAACPYHINPGIRSLSRVLSGKGSPTEIVAFARRYFEKQAMHAKSDPVRLRAFLQACGLGIDCSGFAAWILNELTKEQCGSPLWKYLHFPSRRAQIVSKIRPIENISARLLTHERNAEALDKLTDVRPGDLISAANARHVLIVTEVGLSMSGRAHYFCYAQSSCMYGEESGVRTGYAVIIRPQGSLLEQQWFDNYKENIVQELIAEGGASSQIVRLKALKHRPESFYGPDSARRRVAAQ